MMIRIREDDKLRPSYVEQMKRIYPQQHGWRRTPLSPESKLRGQQEATWTRMQVCPIHFIPMCECVE